MNNQNNNPNLINNNQTPVQPPNFWGEDLMESTSATQPTDTSTNNIEIVSNAAKAAEPSLGVIDNNIAAQQPLTMVAPQPESSVEVIDNNITAQQPLTMVAPQPEPSVEVINNNIAAQQPLTMMAAQQEPPKEEQQSVQQTSKFFQEITIEDNSLKVNLFQTPAPLLQDPLEATKGIQTNELIKAFVGDKYQEFTMSTFSVGAAFFGPLYYYYRKMYLYGILLTLINTASLFFIFINIWAYLIVNIIIFAVLGLYTPTIYLKFCNKKVLKIVMDNPQDNITALQTKCKLNGGTSLILALFLNFLMNGIGTALFIAVGGVALITNIIKQLDSTKLEQDTTTKVEEVINYTLPETFVDYKEKPDFYAYYEIDMVEGAPTEIAACIFNVKLIAGYETSKDLVTHMADTDQRYNRVSTYKSTTGTVWDMYDYTLSNRQEMYLAKKFGKHIVLIGYANMNSSTDGVCDAYLLEIIDSVTKK